jgi:hypothetical protein
MMKTTFITRSLMVGAAMVLLMAGSVRAQNSLAKEPGYLDLRHVEDWFDGEAWLEVNIQGALLKLVAEASRVEDPELTSLLSKLKAIQVRGYPLSQGRFRDVERRTGELAKRLQGMGWETVARVRESEKRVDVYLKEQNGRIAGLVVMVLEPGSKDGSVFVNIVGEIDPEQIGRIGSKFSIDPLTNTAIKRNR